MPGHETSTCTRYSTHFHIQNTHFIFLILVWFHQYTQIAHTPTNTNVIMPFFPFPFFGKTSSMATCFTAVSLLVKIGSVFLTFFSSRKFYVSIPRYIIVAAGKGSNDPLMFSAHYRDECTGWNVQGYIHGSVAGLPILRGRCKVKPYAGVSLVAARSSPKRRYVPPVEMRTVGTGHWEHNSRAECSWFDPQWRQCFILFSTHYHFFNTSLQFCRQYVRIILI